MELENRQFPEHYEYLALVAKVENGCEQYTSEHLDAMGIRAPKCMEKLGTVLSLGERVAACYWSCPGEGFEAHMLQYIAGRANSFGRASVRLALMGFYDEALSLVRSVGEIVNLFMLFDIDASELAQWRVSNSQVRHQQFRPVQIRRRIIEKGGRVPMDETRYHLLCELTTHPVPTLRPQAFNPHRTATTGGHFQEAGFLLALNESAVYQSLAVILAAKLCNVPKEQRRDIKKECVECIEQAGGVNLDTISELWTKDKT